MAQEARRMTNEVQIRELALAEIAEGGPLRPAFLGVHHQWLERGLTRWLTLFEPGTARPILVLGALSGDTLLGAIVGVWDPHPCDRFDALLESGTALPQRARPGQGAWHLIAVTTLEDERTRGLGLGRTLLSHMLTRLAALGHRAVWTLSPVLGLPRLLARWPTGPEALADAILHAAMADGRPALPIMRLHLGAGARLEAILPDSRHDDADSAHANLRFRYDTDPRERETQKARWTRWVAARSTALTELAEDLWQARADREDALVTEVVLRPSSA
jgi:GNAT superfamily N-acetyltransferase